MLSFNFDTHEWINGIGSDRPAPFGTLLQASAHYVPTFGPGGLVFVMGGFAPDPEGNTGIQSNPTFNFKNLTFFDPVTSKTYSQTATGDIPPSPRFEFCTAGWRNTDGGYEK